MADSLITAGQLFGIGVVFGLTGPCLVTCTPFLLGIIGTDVGNARRMMGDVLLLLAGRWCVYVGLGALAGISGALLHRFAAVTDVKFPAQLVTGAVTMAFGLLVLVDTLRPQACGRLCGLASSAASGSGFLLGVCLGIAPCAPLLMLLGEIALIARSAWAGMAYAAAFGLGTLCAGLAIAMLAALSATFMRRVLQRPRIALAIRAGSGVCMLGLGIILLIGACQ